MGHARYYLHHSLSCTVPDHSWKIPSAGPLAVSVILYIFALIDEEWKTEENSNSLCMSGTTSSALKTLNLEISSRRCALCVYDTR